MSTEEPAVSVSTRVYRSLLVALFGLGIFLPLLGWCFALDHTPEPTENRTPAPAPSWPTDFAQLKALPPALESYWNDAFGFRRRLLRWNATAQYDLGVSGTAAVVIGERPWLFYAGEESIEQRRGLRRFSDTDLERWARQLEARRAWLSARGSHFLFVVVPEKQTIYPEALPDRYGPLARTPLDQLIDYLAAHSQVDVLDLRAPVRAARADGEVYFHTDSHWNDRGAYAGYAAIVSRLHGWYPRLEPRTAAGFQRVTVKPWNGDLALMLGGPFDLVSETGEQWRPVPASSAQALSPSGYRPPGSTLYDVFENPGHESLPRAVVFHDSFLLASDERGFHGHAYPANALRPEEPSFRLRALLAEQFSRAAFSWQYAFDAALVQRERPDVVIEEHAERLIRQGPVGAVPRP
jgi:alginate O-acetyltransferase complex protein AlgJ